MSKYDDMKESIRNIIYKAIDHKNMEFILDRTKMLYELTIVRTVLNSLGFTFNNRKTYYNSVVELYKYRNSKVIVKLDLETFNIYITAK